MEGALKRKVSIFRGYQDKWFVLKEDGNMQQYDENPKYSNNRKPTPKPIMNIILADIDYNKDGLRFEVTSTEGKSVKLKASSKEDRTQWITVFKTITQKRFPLVYGHGANDLIEEEEEEENVIHTQESQVRSPAPNTEPEKGSRITFGEAFKGADAFPAERNQKETSGGFSKETHDEIIEKFKNMTVVSKGKRHLMVAAIDFGSAYSGCAFSFKQNYIKDPLDINVMAIGKKGLESLKVPTVLLLDHEGAFKAFGFEAEQQYTDLVQNDPEYANTCYYFSRFKMQLYNNKDLKKSMMIKDITQKEMKAVDVFAFCIEHIKDNVFGRAKEQLLELQDEDVHWVLTVPAIWNESARQFMIDAAEKAGIDPENLTLALEPEAAALCCKCLELQKQKTNKGTELKSFESGARFLVVDLGGGTVDITANEVLSTGQLKEIHSASGGAWGGNTVNAEMWKLLREIFGKDVVKKFITNNRDDYLEVTRAIEIKKRTVTSSEKTTVEIPYSLIKAAKAVNGENVITDKYKDKVKFVKGKLQINPEIILTIFKGGVETIVNYVNQLLSQTSGISTILLVGGYAACDILKNAMREKFKHLAVICPLDPDIIVLKGAVIMGHMDTPIVGRLAKYHYGIAIITGVKKRNAFDRSFKPLTNSEEEFHTIIKKGQPIKVNDFVTEYDFPISFNQDEAFVRIYTCEDDEPPKIISTDHCRQIGHIRIKLPRFRKNTTLKIGISNTETEFKVVARDEHTGHCFHGVCSFLN